MKKFQYSRGMIRAVNINLDESRRLEMNTSQLDTTCLRARCDINHEMHALKDKLRKIQSKTPSLEDAIHNARRNAHTHSVAATKSRHDKPTYAMTEVERKAHLRLERSRIKEEIVAMLQSEATAQHRAKGYGTNKGMPHKEALLCRAVSDGDKKISKDEARETTNMAAGQEGYPPVHRRRCKTALPMFTHEVATVHRIKKVRQIAQVLGEIQAGANRERSHNHSQVLRVH